MKWLITVLCFSIAVHIVGARNIFTKSQTILNLQHRIASISSAYQAEKEAKEALAEERDALLREAEIQTREYDDLLNCFVELLDETYTFLEENRRYLDTWFIKQKPYFSTNYKAIKGR